MADKSVKIRSHRFLPGRLVDRFHAPARVSLVFWISIGLSLITAIVLYAAFRFQIVADTQTTQWQMRERITQVTAQQYSASLETGKSPLENAAYATVANDPEVSYVEIVKANGHAIVQCGTPNTDDAGSDAHRAAISHHGKTWGYVTVHFAADPPVGWTTWARHPFVRMALFFFGASCISYYIFLRRTVGGIEAVVPPHFRATLDSLSQGLLVVDTKGMVIVSNDAFRRIYGCTPDELEQQPIDSLDWSPGRVSVPWHRTIRDAVTLTDVMLRLTDRSGATHILRVNSAPLKDENRRTHGALISFDDVTELQERNAELTDMLDKLRDSRDQIHRQNQELQVLATRDPLTFALNRRSFFEQLKNVWSSSIRYENELSCMMLDVDHFKSINDTHGHSSGDAVLRDLACVLMKSTRNCDITCRYGGEEFCIIMPNQNIAQAAGTAERIRQIVEETDFHGISVTCSFGISSRAIADSPEAMLDMADRALYLAKRDGRNRVVRHDLLSDRESHPGAPDMPESKSELGIPSTENAAPISFQTVSALSSALAYRDAATAEHCRRVADLCVRFARDLMPMRECYILENAALLHDIGKIGVPDSILLKPGPLTKEEWIVMRSNDHIGREIVRSTFNCHELVEIIEKHSIPFGESQNLPLGAKILAIADSFDAMITDRVYRKGRTPDEAFAELRRCAGKQFDPQLIEQFIRSVETSVAPTADHAIVNKKVALRLGMQIETLARALDDQDIQTIVELTNDILNTTANCHLDAIAELAGRLNVVATGEQTEWKDCLAISLELIETCRKAQGVHLGADATQHAGTPT